MSGERPTRIDDDGPTSFDERAATWDDAPHRVERARVAAELIGARVALHPDMCLLEYGAGTGLLSQHLQGSVGPMFLVEPSEGMRQVLLAKIGAGVLTDATVLDLDLATEEPPSDLRCDVIVSMMVIHHLLDIRSAVSRMRRILRDGGHLCIVDLETEDGTFHSPSFRGHHGLDRDTLTDDLRAAGFTAPEFEHAYTMQKNGRSYDLFLATAVAR